MSFILDALKKSEAERQRQSVPGLMDAGAAPRHRGLPVWAIVIGALLAVNVAVLAIVLLRQQHPAPAAAAAVPAAPPAPAAAAARTGRADAAHFSPLDAAPVYAPEIPVDEPAAGDRGGAAAPRSQRAEPAQDTSAQNDEVLPEIGELNLGGAQALPELHLDVHVYATSPADRFVSSTCTSTAKARASTTA